MEDIPDLEGFFRLWIWTVVWINFDTPQILYTHTRMNTFMNTDNLYNYGYMWTLKMHHKCETFISVEHYMNLKYLQTMNSIRTLCTCFLDHLCMIYAHDLEHYVKEYLRMFING